jgi:uncharacterized membrane protein
MNELMGAIIILAMLFGTIGIIVVALLLYCYYSNKD